MKIEDITFVAEESSKNIFCGNWINPFQNTERSNMQSQVKEQVVLNLGVQTSRK